MPSFKKHFSDGAVYGSIVGAISNAIDQNNRMQTNPELKFDWNEFLVVTGLSGSVGALSATVPDLLEPATNPNHRAFFHSWGFSGTLGYGAYKLSQNPHVHSFGKTLTLSFLAGFLIHIIEDSRTPNGVGLM